MTCIASGESYKVCQLQVSPSQAACEVGVCTEPLPVFDYYSCVDAADWEQNACTDDYLTCVNRAALDNGDCRVAYEDHSWDVFRSDCTDCAEQAALDYYRCKFEGGDPDACRAQWYLDDGACELLPACEYEQPVPGAEVTDCTSCQDAADGELDACIADYSQDLDFCYDRWEARYYRGCFDYCGGWATGYVYEPVEVVDVETCLQDAGSRAAECSTDPTCIISQDRWMLEQWICSELWEQPEDENTCINVAQYQASICFGQIPEVYPSTYPDGEVPQEVREAIQAAGLACGDQYTEAVAVCEANPYIPPEPEPEPLTCDECVAAVDQFLADCQSVGGDFDACLTQAGQMQWECELTSCNPDWIPKRPDVVDCASCQVAADYDRQECTGTDCDVQWLIADAACVSDNWCESGLDACEECRAWAKHDRTVCYLSDPEATEDMCAAPYDTAIAACFDSVCQSPFGPDVDDWASCSAAAYATFDDCVDAGGWETCLSARQSTLDLCASLFGSVSITR